MVDWLVSLLCHCRLNSPRYLIWFRPDDFFVIQVLLFRDLLLLTIKQGRNDSAKANQKEHYNNNGGPHHSITILVVPDTADLSLLSVRLRDNNLRFRYRLVDLPLYVVISAECSFITQLVEQITPQVLDDERIILALLVKFRATDASVSHSDLVLRTLLAFGIHGFAKNISRYDLFVHVAIQEISRFDAPFGI